MGYLQLAEIYYKFQFYVDLGWGEFSWFSDSLVELMAILYLLGYMGITINSHFVYITLIAAFVFFYNFGKFLKRKGIYDKSAYVEAELDPVVAELLKAARIIIKHHSQSKG